MLLNPLKFATKAHEGQVRKYTGEPYIQHCIAVCRLVEEYGGSTEMCAAALLHDTVEDCDVSIDDIQREFGDTVAEYVWYLTKPPVFVGNRAKRKEMDRARLREAPVEVRLIKIMDLYHNSGSIKEHDPKFWETFSDEAVQLLIAMDAMKVVRDAPSKPVEWFMPWVQDLINSSAN